MASQDRRFPLEEIASLPEYRSPRASPDGERIAYYHDETGRNELYVQDLSTGDRRQVSDENVPRTVMYPIVWDADGERIFFHEDDDGDEQTDVHAIGLDGATEPVIVEDGQNTLYDVGPDGRHLLYHSTKTGSMELHRYDTETGESVQLTDYERRVGNGAIGPDGERVAYATNESDDLENMDLYVADLDGSNPRRLDIGEEGAERALWDWSPDGDRLLVSDNSTDLDRVGVYDLEDDAVTWYRDGEYVETPGAFVRDGEGLVATRQHECRSYLVHYTDAGEARRLAFDDGVSSVIRGVPLGTAASATLADGDLLVTHQRSDRRKELHRYDVESDDQEVVIDADYGPFDPDDFVAGEPITYESIDGTTITGMLYVPPDARDADGTTPGIVSVHGGPPARSSDSFSYRTQFLLDCGYTVFEPNYRGSTGRGREFKNAIHGDWGGMEQEDVAEAGRWLEGRPWIDEDRVAVSGGSYGGYSAYWQVVDNPELWATGVARVGITHLPSLYEESMPHFKRYLEQQMGDPEENADLWEERSPLTHVENVERPLLMVHGVNDPRCPVSQARKFEAALEERRGWTEGEDFVYEELGEEGHGTTDIEQKIRGLRIVADYLDEWL